MAARISYGPSRIPAARGTSASPLRDAPIVVSRIPVWKMHRRDGLSRLPNASAARASKSVPCSFGNMDMCGDDRLLRRSRNEFWGRTWTDGPSVSHRLSEPIVPEELTRVSRTRSCHCRTRGRLRAVLVAAPADALGMGWPERDPAHWTNRGTVAGRHTVRSWRPTALRAGLNA